MKEVSKYLVSEIKVSYHPRLKASESPIISSSEDAYKFLMEGFDQDRLALQEQFVVLYLNRSNRVLGIFRVSIGGITGTVADPRIILAIALKTTAVSVIIAHNHPSGSLQPSKADEDLTKKIGDAARFMDIKLLDHLIVEPGGSYFSFADQGLLF